MQPFIKESSQPVKESGFRVAALGSTASILAEFQSPRLQLIMLLSMEFQSFISRSAWSINLTDEQLACVHMDAYLRSYPAGALICHRGGPADQWLGVIDGLVKVNTVSEGGRHTTFAGVCRRAPGLERDLY